MTNTGFLSKHQPHISTSAKLRGHPQNGLKNNESDKDNEKDKSKTNTMKKIEFLSKHLQHISTCA